MSVLKLSAECLAAAGAKNEAEFPGKMAALLISCASFSQAFGSLQNDFAALVKEHGETKAALESANTTIAAQAGKIAVMETSLGNPATLTEAKIRDIATVAGSAEAMKALGATGVTPPAPPAQGAAGATAKTTVDQLNAAGKFEEAFAASENIRAEFGTAKTYAAFMKMNGRGHVKINTKE